jgi:hypothetical protein
MRNKVVAARYLSAVSHSLGALQIPMENSEQSMVDGP